MSKITCFIDGIEVEIENGTTILNAASLAGVKVPTLCYHPDLEPWAACGICVVKMEGSPKMIRACATPVAPNMKYITRDMDLMKTRRTVLELILSNHPDDCLKCGRNGNCELQTLAADFGIREIPFARNIPTLDKDTSTASIVLNPDKCISCGRCVNVCQDLQGVYALEFLGRGENTRLMPAAGVLLDDSPCIKCGQCSAHCPVGAIYEKSDCDKVMSAIANPDLHVVVNIAPSVRVAIGEAFGMEPGTIMTGQIYESLRRLGFDKVFDVNFGADLTILEESAEFIHRFTEAPEKLPLITSCCPAWVDYMEKYTNDMIPHFSTCKSPMQMEGAMTKTYYADMEKIDPAKIYNVSIMPCTAKKFEIESCEDMRVDGYADTDVVITTRELARLIKMSGIDFVNLDPDTKADSLLGNYSGAGTIFGATGGVMEAALRTAVAKITGKKLEKVEFDVTRGMEGVKEATLDVAGNEVRIAIAHGMVNIETVLNKIRAAKEAGEETPYHFVEVMACRGGCIGGGGQPHGATDEIRAQRTAGIYSDDEKSVVRSSHENPEIIKAYDDFLGEPNSKIAHKLLHRHYRERPIYNR